MAGVRVAPCEFDSGATPMKFRPSLMEADDAPYPLYQLALLMFTMFSICSPSSCNECVYLSITCFLVPRQSYAYIVIYSPVPAATSADRRHETG